jgi:hypothetical protein
MAHNYDLASEQENAEHLFELFSDYDRIKCTRRAEDVLCIVKAGGQSNVFNEFMNTYKQDIMHLEDEGSCGVYVERFEANGVRQERMVLTYIQNVEGDAYDYNGLDDIGFEDEDDDIEDEDDEDN